MMLSMLLSVEMQFMSHRIELGGQERPSNKLLKHIMELELPINNRRVRARNHRLGDQERKASTPSVDGRVVDSGENQCNPNSIYFNYDGFDCICSRLPTGKVFCTKQQQQQQQQDSAIPNQTASPNDPAVFMMLNNFEKLVAQLASMKTRQSAKDKRY